MAQRADRVRTIATAAWAALLIGAAPPVDGDLPRPAPGFDSALDTGPAPAFAQPKHDQPLEPAIAALVVERLVALHLLDKTADAQDATKAAEAIRGFQAGVGLKVTGVLDRKTLAFFAL
jgi:hypothetical protein